MIERADLTPERYAELGFPAASYPLGGESRHGDIGHCVLVLDGRAVAAFVADVTMTGDALLWSYFAPQAGEVFDDIRDEIWSIVDGLFEAGLMRVDTYAAQGSSYENLLLAIGFERWPNDAPIAFGDNAYSSYRKLRGRMN